MPLVSISTDKPSSGIGGPLALKFGSGALPAITTRSTMPPEMCSSTHVAHLDGGEHRPQPLHHRHRHAGAGDAERQMRLGAGIIQAAGDRDADIVRRPRIDAAEVALLEIDALAHRIDARAHRHPVEGNALLVGFPGRSQDDRVDHRIAARHAEQPDAVLVGGRLQRGAQGELLPPDWIWNGTIKPRRRASQLNRTSARSIFTLAFSLVVIDDGARIREHLALQPLQRAVGRDLGADARRQRQVGLDIAFVEPQRQQNVAGSKPCAPRCRPRARRRRAGASRRSTPRAARDCRTPAERSRRPAPAASGSH